MEATTANTSAVRRLPVVLSKNHGKTIREPTVNLKVWRISNPDIELTANIQLTCMENLRGTQREYSSKPLNHSTVERILVFKR